LSSEPKNNTSNGSNRDILDFIDELAAARLNAPDLLNAVTTALSKLRSGTWVTTLMAKDPSTQLVLSADGGNPSLANYVDNLVAAIDSPGRAPTMSLTQQVIETGRRVFFPNLPYEEFLKMLTALELAYMKVQPPPGAPFPLDVLIVPMRSRGSTIGSLGLFERDATNPVTEQYAQWLQTVADRLGMATENAQLYEDAIMRLDRLSSIQTISRAISANMELAFTLKTILEQVVDQLKVDAADVMLLDARDGMLATAASTGFVATAVPAFRLSLDEGWPGRALTGRLIETVGVPSDFSQIRRRPLIAREGFKSYIAVPVAARGKLAGVMEVFNRLALSPDEEWLSFLESMASVAAIAVDMAELNERINTAAPTNKSAKSGTKAPELSKVEWEMLKLLVEGQTNREISARVHLSQNTIKFHVRQLLQKTGTVNRTDLTRQAIQEGWLR
jgi:GAF domain-containing protein/DNA-binding CsgD family transcriptional regulator